MKAVLIARASSKEQELSLPAQMHGLRDYCKRNGFENAAEIDFSESAYKTERSQFKEILREIKKLCAKETIAVCFDKVDRLSRNQYVKEVLTINELRMAGKIELHFPSDACVIKKDSPANIEHMFDMGIVNAKYYSASSRDNVKRAFAHLYRLGIYPHQAPLGLLNVHIHENGKIHKTIVVDKTREHHILKIYQLWDSNLYTIDKIQEIITNDGLRTKQGNKVSRTEIEKILRNPFYYGYIRSPFDGQLYQHRYPALISKELWERCQKPRKSGAKNRQKEYAYAGLIRCGYCGCAISPFTSSKNGRVYMRCTKYVRTCPGSNLSEEKVTEAFSDLLSQFRLPKQEAKIILDELVKEERALKRQQQGEELKVKKEIHDIQQKIDALLDLRLENQIDQDLFQAKLTRLRDYETILARKLESLGKPMAESNTIATIESVFDIYRNAHLYFKSSQVGPRRAFLKFLLANCVLTGKELTFTLKEPFYSLFNHLNRNLVEQRGCIANRDEIKNLLLTQYDTIGTLVEQFNLNDFLPCSLSRERAF